MQHRNLGCKVFFLRDLFWLLCGVLLGTTSTWILYPDCIHCNQHEFYESKLINEIKEPTKHSLHTNVNSAINQTKYIVSDKDIKDHNIANSKQHESMTQNMNAHQIYQEYLKWEDSYFKKSETWMGKTELKIIESYIDKTHIYLGKN